MGRGKAETGCHYSKYAMKSTKLILLALLLTLALGACKKREIKHLPGPLKQLMEKRRELKEKAKSEIKSKDKSTKHA